MPSTPTRSEQLSFDDDWPGYEYNTTKQPPPPEPTSEASGLDNNDASNPELNNETGPNLRRSQRNIQKPVRYADTWACN